MKIVKLEGVCAEDENTVTGIPKAEITLDKNNYEPTAELRLRHVSLEFMSFLDMSIWARKESYVLEQKWKPRWPEMSLESVWLPVEVMGKPIETTCQKEE